MSPIIGMTARLENEAIIVHRDNTEAVMRAGGMPLVLPFSAQENILRQMAEMIDGLILTGGGDIDPVLFDEEPMPFLGSICPERDALEVGLIRMMLQMNKPVFAICRGCQILNVAAGGNMYQDLASQRSGTLQHMQQAPRSHPSHFVQVKEGTLSHRIVGLSQIRVNSFHHQAVKELAPGFVVSATSADGVIEAIESERHRFVLGVQWHPENMASSDVVAQRLFDAFVEACGQKDDGGSVQT